MGIATVTGIGICAAGAACAAQCDNAAPDRSSRGGYVAPAFGKTAASSNFDAWRASLLELMGSSCERDIEAELKGFVGQRSDRHLVWQTLKDGKRGIRRIAMWQQESSPATEGGGKVRLTALVEVGDALNGHVNVVHGGFSALLLDDLLGQTTMQEARARGIAGAPLTASLNVKYRYPVLSGGTYLAQTAVVSLEPRNKPGPPSWDVKLTATIYDAAGHTCVQAESHYVIKTFK